MQYDEPDADPVLDELSRVIESIADKIDGSEDHGLFVIGAKLHGEDLDPDAGLQTFIDISGYTGILAEAFYAVIREQIESGNMLIFKMLCTVVESLKEDLNIEDGEVPDTTRTLH